MSTFAVRLAPGSRSHPHCSPKRSALSARLSERPRPWRRSDLGCITHPGPSQSAGRTGLGWLAGQMLRSTLEQGEQRRLRVSKRSSGHSSRTSINSAGGYLLPVHGRRRRMPKGVDLTCSPRRYLRLPDGWSRRKPDIAHRDWGQSVGPLELGRVFRSLGRVAGAIRMLALARQLAAVDDEIFVPDRPLLEPAFKNLARAGRVARLRRQ